jgi:hypothetical protein
MNNKSSGIHVGGTSIIMVFTLLFFAMFGSLSLSTAHVDLRNSEKARNYVVGYYEADVEAAKQINQWTADEISAAGGIVSFAVPIGTNGRQVITVTLRTVGGQIVIDEYRVNNTGLFTPGTVIIDDGPGYFTGEGGWGN